MKSFYFVREHALRVRTGDITARTSVVSVVFQRNSIESPNFCYHEDKSFLFLMVLGSLGGVSVELKDEFNQ